MWQPFVLVSLQHSHYCKCRRHACYSLKGIWLDLRGIGALATEANSNKGRPVHVWHAGKLSMLGRHIVQDSDQNLINQGRFGIVWTFLMSLFPAQDVRQHLHRRQWRPEGWRSTSEPSYSSDTDAFIHSSCILLATLTHQLETHELEKTGTFDVPSSNTRFSFFSHRNWPRAKSNHRMSKLSYRISLNKFMHLQLKHQHFACQFFPSLPTSRCKALRKPQQPQVAPACMLKVKKHFNSVLPFSLQVQLCSPTAIRLSLCPKQTHLQVFFL